MTKEKIEYIPFVKDHQSYYCRLKPTKSNGYQTTFNLSGIAFLSSVYNTCHKRYAGTEKIIFKKNYSFSDELVISGVFPSNPVGVVLELMSKKTRKTYCAVGDEAYKIIMMSNRGVVNGRFTFKDLKRYRYSLVLLDPTTEFSIKDDALPASRTITKNYSEDVIKAIYDSLSKDVKETARIDVNWK